MTSILFIGLLIALAAYLHVGEEAEDKPMKAKRQEKSEVIRQLLGPIRTRKPHLGNPATPANSKEAGADSQQFQEIINSLGSQ